MHIKPLPRNEPIKVQFEGRAYEITFDGDGAHVPENLGRHMINQGLAVPGDQSNPKPQWKTLPGGGCGDLIPMFDPWCKQIEQ